uniref:Acetylglutamate kinase n=1 Tax=Centroceras clavulatum TaxID=159503 RepID=A0A4D6WNH9_9FLOR|nr:acetylglutamate kinase [Centroceras clavulatum]
MINTFNLSPFLDNYLPFIKMLRNKIIVIKYGGAAMKNINLKLKVMQDIIFLHNLGLKLVIVHGGGPMINDWLNKVNIKPKFENGFRVTDAKTMEIVEMVLVGKINKELVNLINIHDNIAVGLCGKDANLLLASPMFSNSTNLVGQIDFVNTNYLNLLLNSGYIPVISSVASSVDSKTYNINADTAASSIAQSLNAEKLILLTDVSGVMLDINDVNSLQKKLNLSMINDLRNQGIIIGGMIPKIECCINALLNNVISAHIINGQIEHALLFELLTNKRIGSQITL